MTASPVRSSQTASPVILKFTAAADPSPPDGDPRQALSLRECFEQFVLPELLDHEAAPETISAYRTALNHWEKQLSTPTPPDNSAEYRTSGPVLESADPVFPHAGPPVGEVTDEVVRLWQRRMKAAGQSAANINKQWRHLRPIFRRIGPRGQGKGAAHGLGIIPQEPYLRQLKNTAAKKHKRVVQPQEIDRVFHACGVATWPHNPGIPSPFWWRCALVVWWNFGPRTQDVARYEADAQAMQWESLHFGTPCPVGEIYWMESPHGWLLYTPRKTARTKGEEILVPLNSTAAAYLHALRDRIGESPDVFPCPKCNRSFYAQWRAILAAAELPRTFRIKDLRVTCNNLWDRLSPGLGDWVLGHESPGVNNTYYREVVQRMLDHVEAIPQPDSFRDGLGELPAAQLTLF